MREWMIRRAPNLTRSLAYYGHLRRQSRLLRSASTDERPPERLLGEHDDGRVAGLEGYPLFDPRVTLRSMAPVQMRDEILGLLERVRQLQPGTLLEIGTSGGGTLYLLTRAAAPDAKLASIDIAIPEESRTALAKMAKPGQTLTSLELDSHAPATKERVKELLGSPIDFLFIDGDHTYEGVKADFELYGDLVRPGGLIGFHDINPHTGPGADSGEVPRYWQEIKGSHRSEELIADPGQNGYGIGLIFP